MNIRLGKALLCYKITTKKISFVHLFNISILSTFSPSSFYITFPISLYNISSHKLYPSPSPTHTLPFITPFLRQINRRSLPYLESIVILYVGILVYTFCEKVGNLNRMVVLLRAVLSSRLLLFSTVYS